MCTAVDVCCYKVLCCLLSPCSLQQGSCQVKLTFGLISISLNLKTLTLIYSCNPRSRKKIGRSVCYAGFSTAVNRTMGGILLHYTCIMKSVREVRISVLAPIYFLIVEHGEWGGGPPITYTESWWIYGAGPGLSTLVKNTVSRDLHSSQ